MPGPSLSLVLIDRIPFPRPDDPLLTARQRAVAARGGNGFMAVAASHAALLLAQGAGRLLRRVDDRGVVAVLDSRMATARYGGYLRASLPPFWTTTDAVDAGAPSASGPTDRRPAELRRRFTILAAKSCAPSRRPPKGGVHESSRPSRSATSCACDLLVLLGTGCSTTLQGNAVSVFDDPFQRGRHAGHRRARPACGPTREGPTRDVEGTDDGEIDELAGNAISDIEEFWETAYSETFDGQFTPVEALISWDANGFDGEFCGDDTYGLVNAAFCYDDETIGWDRGELLPALRKRPRRHGRDDGARPRVRPRGAARRPACPTGHPDPGRRAAGRLLRRGRICAGSPRTIRRASR